MASKKKAGAAAIPVDVPSLLASGDSNKSIARAKASVAKKWSLTRAESIASTAQLAWFLVALGRDGEARELVDYIADGVEGGGDPRVWSAASNAIALAARLARQSDDEARRASLVAHLVAHPAVASTPRDAFVKWVAEAEKDVRSAGVESSQRWACEGFARGCARAAYVRETALEGAYDAGSIDVAALEHTITEGLAGLGAYLTR